MSENILNKLQECVDELGGGSDSSSMRYWIATFEENRYKCPYCNRSSTCEGSYPEGCFYDEPKPTN